MNLELISLRSTIPNPSHWILVFNTQGHDDYGDADADGDDDDGTGM